MSQRSTTTGPGCEQAEQERRSVVRLPSEDEEQREQHKVREPERTPGPQRRVAKQGPEPGAEHGHEERADEDQLERKQRRPALGGFVPADVRGQLELRPAVDPLPDEVRQPDHERERGSSPQPGRAQHGQQAPIERKPDHEREHEQQG